jgi:hypothetical protein
MLIAKIKDNSIEKIADIKEFGGFDEIPTSEQLKELGYRKVNLWRDHDASKQKLIACDPVLEEPWVYTVKVENLTQEELDNKKQFLLKQIKSQRNLLLTESDWTQVNDSPLAPETKAKWASYRQKLRDITKQLETSDSVVWPPIP